MCVYVFYWEVWTPAGGEEARTHRGFRIWAQPWGSQCGQPGALGIQNSLPLKAGQAGKEEKQDLGRAPQWQDKEAQGLGMGI